MERIFPPNTGDLTTTPLTETDLVSKAIGGCNDSFGQLYERHKSKIYRRLLYMLHNREDADDSASDTFERAYKAIPRYELRGAPFISWLMQIAHNQGVSHLRSKKKQYRLDDAIDELVDSVEDDVIVNLDANSQTQAINAAISSLSEDQATVIRLRFFEGKEYKDVASEMGKSVEAIRVLQHRALGKLREPINRYLCGDYGAEGVA